MVLSLEQAKRLEELRAKKLAYDNYATREASEDVAMAVAEETAGDDPTMGENAAALAAELAISEGGRFGGAAAGSAVPIIGTAAGWVVGGLAGGASGAYTRQKMLGQEIDYGNIIASAFINIIPIPKALTLFKNKTANTMAGQAIVGAGLTAGEETMSTVINEDRLPTEEEVMSAGVDGAILGAGLGAVGSKLEGAYKKYAGVGREEFNKALRMGDPDARILVDGIMKNALRHQEDVRKNYSDFRLAIKESTMDNRARLQELQLTSGGNQIKSKKGVFEVLDDDVDYNLNSRLAEVSIAAKNAEVKDIFELDGQFLVSKADEMGMEASELSKMIDKYLYAKHAIQFNKAKSKSYKGEGSPAGISNKDAEDIIKTFEDSGLHKTLDKVIESRASMSRQILDTLEEGGIVSSKYAKSLREKYPNYVPLNRVMDEGGQFSPGLYTAIGSDKSVNEVSANILGNLSSAIRMAEVNKANQSFLKLVQKQENRKAARNVVTIYRSKNVKEGSKPGGKPDVPRDVDRDAVVTVFDNGVRTSMAFKDKRLAAAMKGSNKAVLPTYMKAALWYNRTLGSIYTRFNPEFVIPNLFRDRSEAIVNASAKMDLGNAIKVVNPVNDIRTIRRNILNKNRVSSNPEEAKMDALYKQFVEDGGSTGNLGAATVKDPEEAIKALQKTLHKPSSKTTLRKGLDLLERVNSYVEDSTRFNVYRQALNNGMTRKQAALAARDSSFDPLVKGTQGDVLRASYLFANPSIQGARNFIRSMSNRRVAGGVMGTLMATTLSLDLYNQSIDPDWKEKLKSRQGGSWRLDKNLTIVTGVDEDGNLSYFQVPIGYSIYPVKKTADYLQQKIIQQGLMGIQPSQSEMDKTKLDKVGELTSAFIDGYNPMGGSIWPSPFRPWVELAKNEDGLGGDIRPPWLETKNISEVEKVYPWTMETRGGEMAISFAEQLQTMGMEVSPENLLHLYQTFVGGPGNTVRRLFEFTSRVVNKEELKPAELPIARRFFGTSPMKTFEARNYDADTLENLSKVYATRLQKGNRLATNTFNKMKKKETPEEKRLILQDTLSQVEDPLLAEAILKSINKKVIDDRLGITGADRSLKNKTKVVRAEYFLNKINTMPPELLAPYLQTMQQRDILDEEVARIITDLQRLKALTR